MNVLYLSSEFMQNKLYNLHVCNVIFPYISNVFDRVIKHVINCLQFLMTQIREWTTVLAVF